MESTDIRVGLLDLILKFSIFSDLLRFCMIFALFCRILRQFWASELSKIQIYLKSTKDTVLSILPCPQAMVKVFLEKKNSKNFKGGSSYACS